MCGIVGFTGANSEPGLIKAMNSIQKHRGPDDEGYFFCTRNNTHLSMVRLSILDEAGGHQPMFAINQRYCIVFNGEIFNYKELRTLIEGKGYKLKSSHSDTEVLPYLYHIYGISMLNMLNGMFAFVILDREKGEIFFARDHSGIKPFYYSLSKARFSFASEIKSLKLLPWIDSNINYDAVSDYFSFQSIPSPKTIYENIQSLPSASYGIYRINNHNFEIKKYWAPSFERNENLNKDDYPEFIRGELLAAVNRWSLSDVPIACSLSGGLDSAAIVACMSKFGNKKIKTYTLGFEGAQAIDERPLARLVSRNFGTEHIEIVIESSNLLRSIDKMFFHLDQPYAGGLPSWFVYEAMAKDVKVAMSGVGGDELFGNYGKWLWYQNQKNKLRAMYDFLRRGGSARSLVKNLEASLYKPMIFNDIEKFKYLFQGLNQEYSSVSDMDKSWPKSLKEMDQITSVDFSRQLPDEFLYMTDRFSMAHSLEIRTPMLDQKFVKNMLAIPSSNRTDRLDFKYLLRKSLEKWLPNEVINAPKKGFVLPMDLWLKSSLKNDLLFFSSASFLTRQNIFKADIRKSLINPYLDGNTNNVEQIWTWWLFQKWWNNNENLDNQSL